jgi:hypothetical protein
VTVTVGTQWKDRSRNDCGRSHQHVITVPLVTVINNGRRTTYAVKVDARIPSGEQLGRAKWDELPPQSFYTLECLQHDDMWAEGWQAGRLNVAATVTFEGAGQSAWLRDKTGTIRRSA